MAGRSISTACWRATLVAPGHDKVIPLEPEFIVPQDGAEKQDCENMAAKRWLAAHAPRYAALDPVYLGDDLFLSPNRSARRCWIAEATSSSSASRRRIR